MFLPEKTGFLPEIKLIKNDNEKVYIYDGFMRHNSPS